MNHSHVYIHIQQHTTIIHNHTISSHKTQPNIIQTNIVCYIFLIYTCIYHWIAIQIPTGNIFEKLVVKWVSSKGQFWKHVFRGEVRARSSLSQGALIVHSPSIGPTCFSKTDLSWKTATAGWTKPHFHLGKVTCLQLQGAAFLSISCKQRIYSCYHYITVYISIQLYRIKCQVYNGRSWNATRKTILNLSDNNTRDLQHVFWPQVQRPICTAKN